MDLFELKPEPHIPRPKVADDKELTLKAEVVKIIFSSDQGDYAAVRMNPELGNEFTATGALAKLMAGQEVEVTGEWTHHEKHGAQFKVNSFKAILPSTLDGVRRFLGSGALPGLGKKTANKIVDHFGMDTLEILDKYSARLSEIEGLGKRKIKQIKEAWEACSGRRDLEILLQGHGISPALSAKIIAKFGPGTSQIVNHQPYRLDEVKGVGFATADRIAQGMGMKTDDVARIEAGMRAVLRKASERDGHLYLPVDHLVEQAAEMLKVDPTTIQTIVSQLDPEHFVTEGSPENGGVRIYPRHFFRSEELLAEKLAFLVKFPIDPAPHPFLDIPEHLHEAQKQAVATTFDHRLSIVTGGPGVGKTTVIGEIVRQAKNQNWVVNLAAPTGRAAKRLSESCQMEASTIHRLLQWDPIGGGFLHNKDNPLACQLLVIDEVSMVDQMLAQRLFEAIDHKTRVILVGDRDQLPSVGAGAFLHELIYSGQIPVTELTEVFRQKEGSHIITNAHAVNRSVMPDLKRPNEGLSDFYWIEQKEPEKVVATILEMAANRIPQRFGFDPLHDLVVLVPMHRGPVGTQALNAALQNALNPPADDKPEFALGYDQCFRVGDRVMQLRNNYDKLVFNGDMGWVKAVEKEGFTVAFDEDRVVHYERNEADQLILGYAITIHKSQGSEFPAVIMPVMYQHYVMLQKNLIYTGMTRARQLLVMLGDKRALRHGISNNGQNQRFTRLAARIRNY